METAVNRMLACVALLACSFALHAQEFPLPPKDWEKPVMDEPVIPYLLIDRLEYRWQNGKDVRAWDVHGWIGGDYNKLWFRSEGEDERNGRTERADFELFYARRVSPFWHLLTGVRQEERPSPSRSSLALGVQGLAPYQYNVEATAYVSDKGRVSANAEAEFDLLFTQRLILQPRAETSFAASSDVERGLGQGFRNIELGLRLRYEIRRQFAPYVGVTWSRKLGETADLARRVNEDVSQKAVVAGVRIWF